MGETLCLAGRIDASGRFPDLCLVDLCLVDLWLVDLWLVDRAAGDPTLVEVRLTAPKVGRGSVPSVNVRSLLTRVASSRSRRCGFWSPTSSRGQNRSSTHTRSEKSTLGKTCPTSRPTFSMSGSTMTPSISS